MYFTKKKDKISNCNEILFEIKNFVLFLLVLTHFEINYRTPSLKQQHNSNNKRSAGVTRLTCARKKINKYYASLGESDLPNNRLKGRARK